MFCYQSSIILVVILLWKIDAECPLTISINPCSCVTHVPTVTHQASDNYRNTSIYKRSIVCEKLTNNDIINVQTKFMNLVLTSMEDRHFDALVLRNTTWKEIPSNIFGNLTFLRIQFEHNQYLSTIHPDTFRNTNEYVKHFETLNTNLSELIFSTILNQFINLIDITMLNDSIKTIPSYAFRQRKLERLWLGMGYGLTGKQPLKSIAPYAFYYLPKLYFLQIATDYLIELHKYSFALETFGESMFTFEMDFAGNGWSSNSFPLMSLTQCRSRQVFMIHQI
ncbi:unnamed protein product [Didymodactylos carnosus]|uniref:Uncharacterized protein n=1 Tax=Didymodactylos carnosus TaxID=1234261 RepID=A0A815VDP8_9BILA|nr:unnamed protein product [Didymodactylos carnosus]CAF1530701.1 unnamed protein product [Didymodactylos carnosus]CAF4085809.1 unnamed protein product [Didymodactylos carnosus]CAF4389926.1 unnamed protein product [Didymodactylos carnosus]